ncbi:J domain-containing protein [Mycoplana rhizolycopersici]|uniref:DnaJ family molecular chaperone n=1 Tax=Mycoplana rhizolycopersici TaxID=2746702 RepID=A0ABX2QFC2_9HYPH|nr:DnaJ family molecular chaperone [Rhizobium rhizolycopersici]NVP56472.1 DnaJ family molecular chaperone [Rhizobium rhizolycopersici]
MPSIWDRLVSMVAAAASNALSSVVEAVRTLLEGDPETRRQVAFSVAMIALSAKMAKADGVVTTAEVDAFRDVFKFPADQAANVARLYNLARQDVAGYEAYAEKMAALCVSCENNCPILEDIIDGLFHIAKADGLIHDKEMAFLSRVAEIFGMADGRFEQITARHVHIDGRDPYKVLGVSPEDDFPTIRKRYRVLASEHHPDRLMARGVPAEFQRIANDRMAVLNAAYAEIEKERLAA